MPLWLAYGHYRDGILMAPATALRVAQSLIEAS
jgi:glycine/D-amino acid oxidase-like deaminating enzyme